MTDKQIIIDGVDVSGCEFYNKVIGEYAYCGIDEEHLCTCISYDNCYYKQLKRKEQECERLTSTLTEIKEIAEINPINTCWTFLELCEECDENKECDIQCPLFKFKLILQKISEVLDE